MIFFNCYLPALDFKFHDSRDIANLVYQQVKIENQMLSKWQTHLAKQKLNCIEFYMQISLLPHI